MQALLDVPSEPEISRQNWPQAVSAVTVHKESWQAPTTTAMKSDTGLRILIFPVAMFRERKCTPLTCFWEGTAAPIRSSATTKCSHGNFCRHLLYYWTRLGRSYVRIPQSQIVLYCISQWPVLTTLQPKFRQYGSVAPALQWTKQWTISREIEQDVSLHWNGTRPFGFELKPRRLKELFYSHAVSHKAIWWMVREKYCNAQCVNCNWLLQYRTLPVL